jgi:modulator of FtsH protease HflC
MVTSKVNVDNKSRITIKSFKTLIIVVVSIIAVWILFSLCTFTVSEGEQAIVFRLGKIDRVILDKDITFTQDNPDLAAKMGESGQQVAVVYGKGLQFKIPFIDSVRTYDSRLLTYVSQSTQLYTMERNGYEVTLYSQWRIANPALFYQVYSTEAIAANALDNTIEPYLVQSINNMKASDFLSNKDTLNKSLMDSLSQVNGKMRGGGVIVADVQVSRTLLPDANLKTTYDRMIANREKVAQQYRSDGQEAYLEAVAAADLEASKLLADSTKQSKEIMGEADAQALKVYADSYSKDPAFYGYWRSLQALKNSLSKGVTIVLDKNSPLWKDLWDLINNGTLTTK